jgi:putative membrane protein
MQLSNSIIYVFNALIFSLLGYAILGVGFWIFDMFTPCKLWDEIIQNKNVALAIVTGFTALGLAIIVASAIHG